jgi:hypothetical protein
LLHTLDAMPDAFEGPFPLLMQVLSSLTVPPTIYTRLAPVELIAFIIVRTSTIITIVTFIQLQQEQQYQYELRFHVHYQTPHALHFLLPLEAISSHGFPIPQPIAGRLQDLIPTCSKTYDARALPRWWQQWHSMRKTRKREALHA